MPPSPTKRSTTRAAAPSTPPRTRAATAAAEAASPLRRSTRSTTVEATRAHEGRASARVATPSKRVGAPTLVAPESVSTPGRRRATTAVVASESVSARIATPSRRRSTQAGVATAESISAPVWIVARPAAREGSPVAVRDDSDSEDESEDEHMDDEPVATPSAPATPPTPAAAPLAVPASAPADELVNQRPLTEVDTILASLASVPDPWRAPSPPARLGWGSLGPPSAFDYAFRRMQRERRERKFLEHEAPACARMRRFHDYPARPSVPADEPLSLRQLSQRFRSPTPEGYEGVDMMQYVDIPDDDVDMGDEAGEACAADLPPGLCAADLVTTPKACDLPLPVVGHGY